MQICLRIVCYLTNNVGDHGQKQKKVPPSEVKPIWPGLAPLGYRTASAAYAAVRRQVIPPEAFIQIGSLKRIKTAWIKGKLKGTAP